MDSPEYKERTEKNVQVSDGTLILNIGTLNSGTKATYDFTVKHGKPSLIVHLGASDVVKPEHVVRWLEGQHISILNIAGPRESKVAGGIYEKSKTYLDQVFECLRETA